MAFRSRFRSRDTKKQTFLYIFLSFVFIGIMIKWGVPGMIQILSWKSGSNTQSEEKSNIPVQAPIVSNLPEATPSAAISIEGSALSGQVVVLYHDNSRLSETDVDQSGSFVFERINLSPGENSIGVQAVDEDGRESDIRSYSVTYDNKKPELSVTEPKDEAPFYGSDQRTIEIKGVTEEEAEVTVNANYVSVGSSGSFSYRTRLNEGVNEFVIVSTDKAGNQAEKLLRVNFSL